MVLKKQSGGFKKTIVEKTIMALETPCPLMAKVMQNFHSFWTTSLNSTAFRHLERSSQSSNKSTQHKKLSDFVSMCMFQGHNCFHGEVDSTLFPTMPKSAYPQVS